jgi:TetR/AcrR family transcriptional regulator, tetracycline repressor protein
VSLADRGQLSRERIAEEAVAIIDRDGLSGLSMRKLGAALGIEAMSLYYYVTNKEDLLDAVLDVLYARVDIPESNGPDEWESVVRSGLRSLHAVLSAHPSAVALFPVRAASTPQTFSTLHRGYLALRAAGLGPVDAYTSLHVCVSFVIGHASEALGATQHKRGVDTVPAELLDEESVQEFVSAVGTAVADGLFESGLDLMIAALRSRFDLP